MPRQPREHTPEQIALVEAAAEADRVWHQATETRLRAILAAVDGGVAGEYLGQRLVGKKGKGVTRQTVWDLAAKARRTLPTCSSTGSPTNQIATKPPADT